MLFVYNHCGEYNGDFNEIVKAVENDVNHLDNEKMIYIFSPDRIRILNSIANDINVMIGKEELPSKNHFSFFHPNEILTKIISTMIILSQQLLMFFLHLGL